MSELFACDETDVELHVAVESFVEEQLRAVASKTVLEQNYVALVGNAYIAVETAVVAADVERIDVLLVVHSVPEIAVEELVVDSEVQMPVGENPERSLARKVNCVEPVYVVQSEGPS